MIRRNFAEIASNAAAVQRRSGTHPADRRSPFPAPPQPFIRRIRILQSRPWNAFASTGEAAVYYALWHASPDRATEPTEGLPSPRLSLGFDKSVNYNPTHGTHPHPQRSIGCGTRLPTVPPGRPKISRPRGSA
jgi:hypothetical protein